MRKATKKNGSWGGHLTSDQRKELAARGRSDKLDETEFISEFQHDPNREEDEGEGEEKGESEGEGSEDQVESDAASGSGSDCSGDDAGEEVEDGPCDSKKAKTTTATTTTTTATATTTATTTTTSSSPSISPITGSKRAQKPVPEGYKCMACQGKHWIYDCPEKKSKNGKEKAADGELPPTSTSAKKKHKSSVGTNDPSNKKVFVSGLPFTVNEATTRNFFEKMPIVDVSLMRFKNEDKKKGRCNGQAILRFETEDGAKNCIQLFDGKTFENRIVNCGVVLSRMVTKHKAKKNAIMKHKK